MTNLNKKFTENAKKNFRFGLFYFSAFFEGPVGQIATLQKISEKMDDASAFELGDIFI